jgi:hypothetical protein
MNAAIYTPSDQEIAYLAQLMQLPGYQVLEKINLSELDMLQVAFMNVEGTEENFEKKLAAKHALAKGGAQFYTKVCERITGYVTRLGEKNSQPPVLPDTTSELFD